ncbi:ATP-grasp domain-containing protein [Micromonospora sp. CA-246542]|uniref:ATP-grasp domain-containing protein n=1 Tax=Micromonospora sp. CA-246542 TaxID=3239959 RepID=UPI003D94741E
MKTAVVLSFRAMGAFRHDLLRDPRGIRIVLIVSDLEWATVDAERHAYFHQVHVVPCAAPDGGSLLSSAVDPQAARAALREVLAEAPGPVTLHCFDELSMIFAAELRAEFGLRGPLPADILPFRDKCVMKERLIAANVRVPRFGRYRAVDSDDLARYFDHIIAHVGLPFILKPIDSAGSHGVYVISTLAELRAADARIDADYEFEELITGTMYSVNLVSQDRRVLFGGVTEYLVNTLDVRRGQVNADINLADDDPRVARMVGFATQAMAALGWPDGASHLELFHTEADELIFLEVGARFKGLAGLAAMQRNYGIALVNLALQVEAGVASEPYPDEQIYCFDAVIPKRSGVVDQLHGPPLVSNIEITWKVKPGDLVDETDSLFAAGGTILVSNKDYDVLYQDFYRLAGYQPITYRSERSR